MIMISNFIGNYINYKEYLVVGTNQIKQRHLRFDQYICRKLFGWHKETHIKNVARNFCNLCVKVADNYQNEEHKIRNKLSQKYPQDIARIFQSLADKRIIEEKRQDTQKLFEEKRQANQPVISTQPINKLTSSDNHVQPLDKQEPTQEKKAEPTTSPLIFSHWSDAIPRSSINDIWQQSEEYKVRIVNGQVILKKVQQPNKTVPTPPRNVY